MTPTVVSKVRAISRATLCLRCVSETDNDPSLTPSVRLFASRWEGNVLDVKFSNRCNDAEQSLVLHDNLIGYV